VKIDPLRCLRQPNAINGQLAVSIGQEAQAVEQASVLLFIINIAQRCCDERLDELVGSIVIPDGSFHRFGVDMGAFTEKFAHQIGIVLPDGAHHWRHPVRIGIIDERVDHKSFIAKTGYVPNLAARSLRSQKTGMVLVVLPDLANTFFSKILRGIEETLFEAGYGMIISDLDGSPEKEAHFAAFTAAGRVDGAILLNGHLFGQTREGEGKPARITMS